MGGDDSDAARHKVRVAKIDASTEAKAVALTDVHAVEKRKVTSRLHRKRLATERMRRAEWPTKPCRRGIQVEKTAMMRAQDAATMHRRERAKAPATCQA
jgi:hypothetical protein